MARRPVIDVKHRICVICEGYEDYAYFNRLLELNVWSNAYVFSTINAKSASNIFARFQDAFQNDRYEIILVFCDTDKAPDREYSLVKKSLNKVFNKHKAAEKLIIFANPCTMQIILSHFGDVLLKNQGKRTNAPEIEKWTGIKDYDAHEDQIMAICRKIIRSTYDDMKRRVEAINFSDTTPCSTNFFVFLNRFEDEDVNWVSEINKKLRE